MCQTQIRNSWLVLQWPGNQLVLGIWLRLLLWRFPLAARWPCVCAAVAARLRSKRNAFTLLPPPLYAARMAAWPFGGVAQGASSARNPSTLLLFAQSRGCLFFVSFLYGVMQGKVRVGQCPRANKRTRQKRNQAFGGIVCVSRLVGSSSLLVFLW